MTPGACPRTLLAGCAVALALVPASAHAHRLDEYLQAATLRLAADRVAVHLRLVPGADVARLLWDGMDRDGDGRLSPAEQQAYARRVMDDVALEVDGHPAPLTLVTWSFPTRADMAQGVGQISLGLDAPLAGTPGVHRLRLVSRHRPAPSVYLVNTLAPADGAIRITGQRRSVDQAAYDLDFALGSRD